MVLESQVDIDFTASSQEFGFIQGLLAPMKFLRFQSMEAGRKTAERRIRIPPEHTPMLPFVLAALASRYDIGTTPHGASDSGPNDMEVDGHTTDRGNDEQGWIEDGEEGEEEAEDDDEGNEL